LRLRNIIKDLKISKSSYFRELNKGPDRDLKDFNIINTTFAKYKGKLGIRQLKMHIERETGLIFNKKKIARIKRKFNLETVIRRKSKYRLFKKKDQEHKTFSNILARDFKQKTPDKVYSTEITQINYGHKKAYVAAVKDLCTNEIVSKSVSNRIDIKLTNSAIDKALKKLTKEKREGLMIHSDQGFHFTHISYRLKLKENGITQSMSRKGNCIDNAPIESFFGHLKDLLDLKSCKSIEDITKEVTKKINYYNHRRPQLGLKKMPPSEYRRHINS
jgi:transposase InsO family protein